MNSILEALLELAKDKEGSTSIAFVLDRASWEECMDYLPENETYYLYYNVPCAPYGMTTHMVHLRKGSLCLQ